MWGWGGGCLLGGGLREISGCCKCLKIHQAVHLTLCDVLHVDETAKKETNILKPSLPRLNSSIGAQRAHACDKTVTASWNRPATKPAEKFSSGPFFFLPKGNALCGRKSCHFCLPTILALIVPFHF